LLKNSHKNFVWLKWGSHHGHSLITPLLKAYLDQPATANEITVIIFH